MQAIKKSVMIVLKALVPVAAASIFLETLWYFYSTLTHFYYNGYILLAVLYGVIFAVFLHMYGGTKIDTEKKRNLILACTIALFITNAIIYVMLSLVALRFFNPLALIASIFVQIAVCSLLYLVLSASVRIIYPPLSCIAVTSGSESDTLTLEKIKAKDTRHRVQSVINVCDLEKSTDVLDAYDTVLVGDVGVQMRNALLSYCYKTGKEILIIPSMHDILMNNSTQYIVDDKLLYIDKYMGFSTEAAFVKRFFDIVFSLLGIIISSPVMAAVAIAIRAYDKGPALFRQKRLTKDGKEFTIVKFRSMIQNAEKKGGTFLVLNDDDRITPVGKFIRATRLDELPQLFNILKGDMSFVGPRPERPELYDIYCKVCPEFIFRLKVKAGLTGYAQVYGKYNTSAEDKVKLDLLYIEQASVMQDLQLLLYTVKIIFVKDSTEGIKDVERAAKK